MKDFEKWFEEDWDGPSGSLKYTDHELEILAKKFCDKDRELLGQWALNNLGVSTSDDYALTICIALACVDERRAAKAVWDELKENFEKHKKWKEDQEAKFGNCECVKKTEGHPPEIIHSHPTITLNMK